jgi:acetyl-CoA carboxylase biotin carboxyl carrier protein
VPLDINQIRELLATLNQTDITVFQLKSDEFELLIHRGSTSESVSSAAPVVVADSARSPQAATGLIPDVGVATTAASASAAPSVEAISIMPPTTDRRWVEIRSPMVGTFYRAPAPDEPPFVDVGDRIRSGQTVCIIEAMKLMNEIEAEMAGEIIEILVQNGEPVEYNQPLMRVIPA